MIELYHGDCLEVMKNIPDESVDLILTDPPYGTVKSLRLDGQKESTYSWDDAPDLDALFKEYFRTLRPKGKLIIFSQNKFTQELRSMSSTFLEYLYPLIWVKNNFANYLSVNKAPVQIFEDISVFEKIYGVMPKSRAYAQKVLDYIGKSSAQINRDLEHTRTQNFFRTKTLQFDNITAKTYDELIQYYNIDNMDGFLTHNEWLELYNGEREETRAKTTFNIPDGQKHVKNLFEVPKERESLHPTQKPVNLLEQLIEIYTEPDALILDNYMGSGSTGVACKNTGRNFIGIELDDEYFAIAKERIESHEAQLTMV